jgi:glycosyltransferase involved in cell wall biosynthesis
MKRILIIAISAGGHHPGFVRHILRSLDEEASEVLLAGRHNLISNSQLDVVRHRFTPIEIRLSKKEEDRLNDFSRLGLTLRQFCVRSIYARIWKAVNQERRVEMVIVPYVDDCSHAIAIQGSPFGDTPWVGVSMRTQFHFPNMGVLGNNRRDAGIPAALFRRLLKQPGLKELLTNDPTLAHFAKERPEREYEKVEYLPDICDSLDYLSKSDARKLLGFPQDCKVILVYGALSPRKGISHLIQAMGQTDCPENIRLVLAGNQDAATKQLLEGPTATSLRASTRLHVISGYIPTHLAAQLVHASDAMWIGYIDFFTMSGILVTAARHGLPAITCRQGVVGYLARLHGCGVSVDPRSEESILDVLQRLSRGDPAFAAAAERASAAFEAHNDTEFCRVFKNSLQAVESR